MDVNDGASKNSSPNEPKKVLSHYKLFPLAGHTSAVNSVAWSADGRRLASGSEDKTVRVWDAASGTLEHILEGHTDIVNSVAWSADGRRVASGSNDNTARVWDAESGTLEHTLEGHTNNVNSVAWSADGRRVASGSADNTVRVWDTESGTLEHMLEGHTSTVNSVAWSADGHRVASGSADSMLRVWDGESGTLEHMLKGHTYSVTSVAWSADGGRVVSGSADTTVRVWDTESGTLEHTLEGHTDSVNSVAWSADGHRVASGSDDRTVRVWDGERGILEHTLEGHTDWVRSVAWSVDGRRVASGSNDHTVRVWDAESGSPWHLFQGHTNPVMGVAWSADGRRVASGSSDATVRIWNGEIGTLEHILEGHTDWVNSVAWSTDGRHLASGSRDNTIRVWDGDRGTLAHTLEGHTDIVNSVAWSADGRRVASGSADRTVRLWDAASGTLEHTLEGHTGTVLSVAWSADGRRVASGSADNTVRVWDAASGTLEHGLEGHTDTVNGVSWSDDSGILVSQSDTTVRLWRTQTWETIEIVEGVTTPDSWDSLYYFPHIPRIATLDKGSTAVHLWSVDLGALQATQSSVSSVHYTTAKIALVGESHVGKSGLGYRLAENRFQLTESTHGQQFWLVDELGTTRQDGTLCEAILWDFAGQPNYRPVHALFLEDIDIALLLFDPARPDTLAGVDFWLKQLGHSQSLCHTILVAARSDVSQATLSPAELALFCRERNIDGGYVVTSAKLDEGISELRAVIRQQMEWEAKPTTVTTLTFKRIKEYVLQLKTAVGRTHILVSSSQLRQQLEATDPTWQFSDEEMLGAVGHLQNHGYVTILRRSSTEERILLAPDVLINLAASFLLKAQANEKGLGSLDEARVLRNDYKFPEVERLSDEERDILLNAVAELFLKRAMCFRESVDGQTFLIFPSLILERPPRMVEDAALVEDVTYVVSGNVENLYAALVVLLGYAPNFHRTHQWRKQAQYETKEGAICSFKLVGDEQGELELVLHYGANTLDHTRMRFQGLFQEILSSHDVRVSRYPALFCPQCGRQQSRQTIIRRIQEGKPFLFCEEDGAKISLPKASSLAPSPQVVRAEVDRDKATSKRRTSYETDLVRVKRLLRDRGDVRTPTCFVSYAWGIAEQERWVLELANDLRKADIEVILDQIHNAAIGSNIGRFITRIDTSNFIVVVGTPSYYEKYENKVSSYGSVVAAEVDLIHDRLMGTEPQKESVLPVLLDGEERASFPPLMRRRVYGDFRREEAYFVTLFDLILTLHQIPFEHVMVQDIRAKLREEVRERGRR